MREEVHRWVYDNVRAKWPTVLRHRGAERLAELFTGYHAPRFVCFFVCVVAACLLAAGVLGGRR